MDSDQQLVAMADLALVSATEKYIDATVLDRLDIKPSLDDARSAWASARFRLLFPDSITLQQDIDDARNLKQRIDAAADKQQLIQGLLDLAGLLLKFGH